MDKNETKSIIDYPILPLYNQDYWNQDINGCDDVVNLAGERMAASHH